MPRPHYPGGSSLSLAEQRVLTELASNDTVYFGDNPKLPVEGDCRLIKVASIVEGQRYEHAAWNTKSAVISNSMYTDRFVLRGLLKGFLDGATSLIRTGRQSESIVVGEASHTLRLNGMGTPTYTQSLSTEPTRIIGQPSGAEEQTLNQLEFWSEPFEYEMVIQTGFYFNTATTPPLVYVRWTAHTDPLKTDASLVYESCSTFDYAQAIANNLPVHQMDTVTGLFNYADKPLYLKDMLGERMYYTVFFSENVSITGATIAGQFFPRMDQWQYKQEVKTLALQEALEHEVKTADFLALNANNYLVDCTGGTVNVTINAKTNLFTIGDYANTWNNSDVVNVILGTDTIQLGQQNREKYYIFIRVGTTFRVYSSQGEFKTEGNV